ncbi:MAG: CoA-binding protein [Chloroflexota bacterium]|nr:CoA-binding protein [Chloroflexota bacterium]
MSTSADPVELMRSAETIAVVGVSARSDRASYEVAEYLIEAGYEVYLVNPRETEILGKKVYDRVQDLPKSVDIVDIFRKPADVLPVVEDAIEASAGAIWMQLEIVNQEAAELAQASGLEVVMDRCTKIEHRKIS